MYSTCFKALDKGALILTSNVWLSRHVSHLYGEYKVNAGAKVWSTPAVMPFSAWLRQYWQQRATLELVPTLLSGEQARMVYERVIGESDSENVLLNIPALAETLHDARIRVRDWRIPLDEIRAVASEDVKAFLDWSRQCDDLCRKHDWLEPAALLSWVIDRIKQGGESLPQHVILLGIDRLSPAQKEWVSALEARGLIVEEVTVDDGLDRTVTMALNTSDDEIRVSALWCAQRIEQDSCCRTIVVVPGLSEHGARVERIYNQVFNATDRARPVFQVSCGVPLSDNPLISAALNILSLAQGESEFNDWSLYLRSPFNAGGQREFPRRCAAERALRENKQVHMDLRGFHYLLTRYINEYDADIPLLIENVDRLRAAVAGLQRMQSPAEWAGAFSGLLTAAGWPGDRALTQAEREALQKWNSLLDVYTGLDHVASVCGYRKALSRLRRIARQTRFAVSERDYAPIQVIDIKEASGLQCDALWLMGMSDEIWPESARPNPLLPVSVQRRRDLPQACAERVLLDARLQIERLCSSAAEVVISYPAREGDRDLRPSPLIQSLPTSDMGVEKMLDDRIIRQAQSLETAVDPPLPYRGECNIRGGTAVIKHQSDCPFRAFARYRLRAEGLATPDVGLDARDRGSLVHRTFELLWKRLKSQAVLLSLDKEKLSALIGDVVEQAIADYESRGNKPMSERFKSIEKRRLQRLVVSWLDVEGERNPFVVEGCEVRSTIDIEGYELDAVIDRVDRLEDGRRVIMDYKTGEVNVSKWFGERPEEPQLPLYSVFNRQLKWRDLAAITYVKLKSGMHGFKGISNGEEVLPEVKPVSAQRALKDTVADWDELEAHWRTALTALANEFIAGELSANPRTRSCCMYCDLTSLCRIHELDSRLGTLAVEEE